MDHDGRRGANFQVQRAFFDRVWEQEQERAIYDLFDGEASGIDPARQMNPDSYRPWHRAMLSQLGGVRIELTDWLESGDRMSLRFVLRAWARRTGARVEWAGAGWGRYAGGKLVEAANYLDTLSLFRQLDLLPAQAVESGLTGENVFGEVEEAARRLDERGEYADPWLVRCGVARPARRFVVMPGADLRGDPLAPRVPMSVLIPGGAVGLAPLPDEGQLEVLFDSHAFGMLLVDAGDRILETNLTFTEFVDEDLDSLLGRPFARLLHPDDRPVEARLLRELLGGRRTHYRLEARLLRGSAVVPVHLAAARVQRPDQPDLVLRSVRDASETRLEEIVRFQETERRLLAYDLHDGLAQDLASLWLHFQTGQALEDPTSPAARALREKTLELVRRMSRELQQKVRDLQNPLGAHVDLPLALADLARGFHEDGGLQVEVALSPGVSDLVGVPALFVYRIVQEALRNALRHGGARHATVRLALEGGRVEGEVRDDGAGFDPDRIVSRRGYGLAGMRERCSLLEGALTLSSSPGAGATVRFRLRSGRA